MLSSMREQEHTMVLMKLITKKHMLVNIQNNMKVQELTLVNMIVHQKYLQGSS